MAHILIIDDDKVNREILKMYLEPTGHRVTAAKSGEEGLDWAQQSRPDLIFVDGVMPGLDGWETSQAFRQRPETAAVPIVMLTGVNDPKNQQHSQGCGVSEYLTKPYTPQALVELTNKYLPPQRKAA